MVKRRDQRLDAFIVRTALDTDRPLADGWQALFRLDEGANTLAKTQPNQTRCRQDDGVIIAVIQLGQPRVDVSAQWRNFQVRPPRLQLALAAKAGCTDRRTLGQGVNVVEIVRYEGIARILALHDPRQLEPFREFHGNVLHAVDGDIGRSLEHADLEFLDEKPLAADLGQWGVENPVALCCHAEEFDLDARVRRLERGLHMLGLPHGEWRLAGCDPDQLVTHGYLSSTGCLIGDTHQFEDTSSAPCEAAQICGKRWVSPID